MWERRQQVIRLARSRPPGPAVRAAAPHLRPIDIEAALKWAYTVELPKTPRDPAGPPAMRAGWAAMSEWLDELSLAGRDLNRYGVAPDPMAETGPHPDAVTIHETVCALDHFILDLPEGWSPLADFPNAAADADRLSALALERLCRVDPSGARKLRRAPRALIERHAIMGGCPDWRIEPFESKLVQENGRTKWFRRRLVWTQTVNGGEIEHEVEVDGFDHKRRIPYADAYPKTVWEPDPLPGVMARGEYEVWRAALDVLAADLDGALTTWAVRPTARPWRPWEMIKRQGGAI